MLTRLRPVADGFTLVEVLVVISISAFMMVLMLHAFTGWNADYRIRAAAEALLDTVRQAQADAIAHNRYTAVIFTNGQPAYNATPSTSGVNWLAEQLPLGPDESLSAASVLSTSKAGSSSGLSITSSPSTGPSTSPICFNALGQLASVSTAVSTLATACIAPTDGSPIAYTVASVASSSARKLRVLVYPDGQTRLCDPLKTLSSSQPDGCP